MSFPDIKEQIRVGARPSATLLRAVLRAGLIDPPNVTLEEAGRILNDIGGRGRTVSNATDRSTRPGRRHGR